MWQGVDGLAPHRERASLLVLSLPRRRLCFLRLDAALQELTALRHESRHEPEQEG